MEGNNRKKANAGITLIALIITVIVMLILAGVAINLTIGDNGIFKKTQEASEISKKASIKEDIELKITDMEMEKLKEGQTLTKEDIAEKLPGMGVEVTDQTDTIIEGEVDEYPIIIDENNKVTVGDKIVGVRPTGTAEILTEGEGLEEVEIRVTGEIEEGEITAIEATNGAELKTEESATSKIFKVNENGTYYFKIKASNGRSAKVSCNVTNLLSTSVDLFTAIKETTNSGVKKVRVIGSQNTETYSLNVIRHEGNMILDGSTAFEGATLANNVYEFGASTDVATANAYAQNTVVLKVEGDLTINSGVTLTAVRSAQDYGGPKGLIVYCTGTLTNNGTISMTARGAKAVGQNVYLFKNANGSYEYIPAVGGAGAGGISGTGNSAKESYHVGRTGGAGTNRGTGGGGSGGVCDNSTQTVISGNGGSGTSYSGGSASGGAYGHSINAVNSPNAPNDGGAGTLGNEQGAGNPVRRNRRIACFVCFNHSFKPEH